MRVNPPPPHHFPKDPYLAGAGRFLRRSPGPDPQAAEGGGGEAPRAPAPPTLPPAHRASNLALTEFSWQITPSRTASNLRSLALAPADPPERGGGAHTAAARRRETQEGVGHATARYACAGGRKITRSNTKRARGEAREHYPHMRGTQYAQGERTQREGQGAAEAPRQCA
ncbi:hypothetical protein NDU88_006452 [Pleurodeles waltl]|uniref:Uncharacterized protein n=1 Tax=Pleurodeles waltl TaxID=8319 RepID=A0AAV7TYK5_PLEWA|nr:hypothetical protein NDU88_006452 [Pleurodeles waltl]